MRYVPKPMVAILTLLLIAIPPINSGHSSLQHEVSIPNMGNILVQNNFAENIFFEYGSESGVLQPPWDGVGDADTAEVTVSTEQARTGTYAVKFYVGDYSIGDSQHCKVLRWRDAPTDHADAYFSAWFYFPTGFSITGWRNIFQWKDDNINEDPPGRIMFAIFPMTDMEFGLYLKGLYQPDIPDDGDTVIKLTDNINDLLDQWVHIQVHIVRGSGYKVKDGTIQIWINNVLRYDNNAIATRPMYEAKIDYQWGVGNYGGVENPDDQTLYVDDVVASSEKVPESYEVVDR